MHEFIPEKINEQLETEADKAEQKLQDAESSQCTQPLTGKLAFIIDVLWWLRHNLPCLYTTIGDDQLIFIFYIPYLVLFSPILLISPQKRLFYIIS
jgi:hypothetical protein